MSTKKSMGRVIAFAGAAFLATASIAMADTADNTTGNTASKGLVKCYGVNTCKAAGNCKTASNRCSPASNSCQSKAKNPMETTAKQCQQLGGSTRPPAEK